MKTWWRSGTRLWELPDKMERFTKHLWGLLRTENLSSVVKQRAAAMEGMSSEKTAVMLAKNPCRSYSECFSPSATWMQIWNLFLFRSEQGNLTSCLELSNVFEISKYSIPENSAWSGSGITLSSPRHCPYCAIICHVIYFGSPLPDRPASERCGDAASTLTPHTSLRPRAVITPPSSSGGRRCMQFGPCD